MAEQDRSCPRCGEEHMLRLRDFSDQATAALLTWGELDESIIGKPICNNCYEELREVLIDRAGEMEEAASSKPAQKKPAKVAKVAKAKKAKTKTKSKTKKVKKAV